MLIRNFLYITLLLFFQISLAQKEASHWYFGQNAGLDFSSGNPVSDSNGSLSTSEGCTTISNSDGTLLFYTDGSTIWNRNHNVMPKGKGLFGNSSSTQSAIIVPKPDDENIYYVFTVDWGGGDNGLNFYAVDMTLDGGLGDVIGAGGLPARTNLLSSPMSEKITAVQAFDEEGFWVISLKEGKFYVYKVDDNGVNTNPVSNNNGFSIATDARGYLKTSPDGTKLVSANMSSGLFLYDFDDATGIVSNERNLNILNKFAYGVEFSPLSKKLYVSTGNYNPDGSPVEENLFQFTLDLDSPTRTNLNATRIQLHSYYNKRAALQIGLDGKIYRAIDNKAYLGVINFPEADGLAANYEHQAVNLGSRRSRQGLPPFIQSFFVASIQVEDQCLGDETSFNIISNEQVDSIEWDFGDGSVVSTELNPKHIYANAGEYTLNVKVTSGDDEKTIQQNITIFELPVITSPITLKQCDEDNDGISNFNLKQSEILISQEDPVPDFTYHLTIEDAENKENSIQQPQIFSNSIASQVFVRVENQMNCYQVAELNLQVSTTAIPSDFKLLFEECDTNTIDGDDTNGITTFDFSSATEDILSLFPPDQKLIVSYYEKMEDALAIQNELNSSNFRNINSPYLQQIIVRVDNEINNDCVGLGYHIELVTHELPGFDLMEEDILCLNYLPNPLVVSVTNPNDAYSYEWRNSRGDLLVTNTTSLLEVTESGSYTVTAINKNNCERSKKITIHSSNIATIDKVDIEDVSENNSIIIHVTGEGDSLIKNISSVDGEPLNFLIFLIS